MKNKINKLTNKQIEALKIFCIFTTLILGCVFLYDLTLPKVETTPISIFSFIGICLGVSFIIHGFHPILLSKRGNMVEIINKKE